MNGKLMKHPVLISNLGSKIHPIDQQAGKRDSSTGKKQYSYFSDFIRDKKCFLGKIIADQPVNKLRQKCCHCSSGNIPNRN